MSASQLLHPARNPPTSAYNAALRYAERVASISVRAHHKALADEVAEAIRVEAPKYGCLASGVVRMPTEIHRWTVNRSVFVNKKSQEAFERRTHKRLVDVYAVEGSTPAGLVHALMERPPLGTLVKVRMFWSEEFEHTPRGSPLVGQDEDE